MFQVYLFNELEEFFGEDDWKLQIDVTDIWNQYNEKKVDLLTFNKKYSERLVEYKSDITQMGDDVWTKLTSILEKLSKRNDESDSLPVYEDIYDWADQNDILIKTK